jgi:hypothetical protein
VDRGARRTPQPPGLIDITADSRGDLLRAWTDGDATHTSKRTVGGAWQHAQVMLDQDVSPVVAQAQARSWASTPPATSSMHARSIMREERVPRA